MMAIKIEFQLHKTNDLRSAFIYSLFSTSHKLDISISAYIDLNLKKNRNKFQHKIKQT